MYNDSIFPSMLRKIGFPNEKIENMESVPLKKQIELWNEYNPLDQARNTGASPDTTTCFIAEGETIIATARVVRFHTDHEDRDKARKYSLAKALKTLPMSKEERTIFWSAYLTRCEAPVMEQSPLAAASRASL